MSDNPIIQLESPPRTTGNAQQDLPILIDWFWRAYLIITDAVNYINQQVDPTVSAVANLPDPDGTTLGQAQQTANDAFSLATTNQTRLNGFIHGEFDIVDTDVGVELTFGTAQEDDDYRVMIQAIDNDDSGGAIPDGAYIVKEKTYATDKFTAIMASSPGAGNTITFEWQLIRNSQDMSVSENEFELIQGNSYRGSRYSNFVGGGIDAVGNVSSGATENQANSVGTSVDSSQDVGGQTSGVTRSSVATENSSDGLTGEVPSTGDLVIGAGLPYAGRVIGQAAGPAIASGAGIGQAAKIGVSSLANKVSGGLIGSATPSASSILSAPTGSSIGSTVSGTAARATGSAASTASQGVGSRLTSASNLGGAAGAGIATAAATLILTGDVKEAAKSGVATAIGTAIGNAILPGIGGFVGGFIGGLFCFSADTPILMADGTQKPVQDVMIGEEVLHGGLVIASGQAMADDVYEYKGVRVTSFHAVFENGKWLRVEDSDIATPADIEGAYEVVYPIATENHVLLTPWFISRDLLELDEQDADGLTSQEIIDFMNDDTEELAQLISIEKELPHG